MHITSIKSAGDNRIKKAVKAKTVPKYFLANLEKILAKENASDEAKKGKDQRRSTLRDQSPDKLLRFMIAYPPSIWERGRTMSDGTFRSLLSKQHDLVIEQELLEAPFFSVVLNELQAPPDTSTIQITDNVRAGQSPPGEHDYRKANCFSA